MTPAAGGPGRVGRECGCNKFEPSQVREQKVRCMGLLKSLKDAVFPLRCHGCRKLYGDGVPLPPAPRQGRREAEFAAWAIKYFCPDCARAEWTASPLCVRCGLPFATSEGVDHCCHQCTEAGRSFDAARAAGIYSVGLRTLIHELKYRGREDLAMPLGRLLWAALVEHWDPDDFDWIVPVPLHWTRLVRRGFNQAEVLVRCWPQAACEAGAVFHPGKIARRLLVRRRATASQTGLGRRQRDDNLRKAFRMRKTTGVRGRHFLMVDDVFTTGATAEACSRVLKRAGAASVNVLTLARAV